MVLNIIDHVVVIWVIGQNANQMPIYCLIGTKPSTLCSISNDNSHLSNGKSCVQR